MAKKQFVIGMDGGATKTAAMLSDLSGNVLAEETSGPSNPQVVGFEKVAEVIVGLAEELAGRAGCKTNDIVSLIAGLAGAGRDGDKDQVKAAVASEAKRRKAVLGRVGIETDGRIALEGAFKGKSGIIIIAGTGSFALAKDHKGSTHRVGGWGRILGDEGSGYTIGRDGLNAVTKHLDGRGKPTLLTALIDQRFGLSNHEKIIGSIYRSSFDVATVAPLVVEAAEAKDPECQRILNKATFELFEHVRVLVNKIEESKGARAKIPVAFIGGLISNDNVYRRILTQKITFSMPQVHVIVPEASPTYGAVLLSIRSAQDQL
jgi:N-acetylglucosamine kinase-like BadF-type ATPase